MTISIQPFIDHIMSILATHRLGPPGAYRRWNAQPGSQLGAPSSMPQAEGERDLGINPYGCADAANLLYTINHFPQDPVERASWVAVLRNMQDPLTGLFTEGSHHPYHTSAHCIAALELFDALPIYPIQALASLRVPGQIAPFLDGLDWRSRPWSESHKGAGVYVCLWLSEEVGLEWQQAYFSWLAAENDPQTGLWRKGCVGPGAQGGSSSRFPHLAGTFHYLFNHEYARQALPHPAALVDTCLEMSRSDPYPLGQAVGFAEIDWVFCLTRAVRQSGHRFVEAHAALQEFAIDYLAYLESLDPASDDGLNDLHRLFGVACCLAELQSALPGQLSSDRPLRLVLDRRPFI